VIKYRVELPNGAELVDAWIERLSATEAATAREMGTLRAVPGIRRHWHLSGTRGSGTVEISLDPGRRCVVVAVHDNRHGVWAVGAAARLAAALQQLADESRLK
jgi:hypothetical protein